MTTDQRAHKLLQEISPVPHISDYGRALLEAGVVSQRYPAQRISAQGAALLAGKWLRRLEVAGLATLSKDGWCAV